MITELNYIALLRLREEYDAGKLDEKVLREFEKKVGVFPYKKKKITETIKRKIINQYG